MGLERLGVLVVYLLASSLYSRIVRLEMGGLRGISSFKVEIKKKTAYRLVCVNVRALLQETKHRPQIRLRGSG